MAVLSKLLTAGLVLGVLLASPMLVSSGVLTEDATDECIQRNSDNPSDRAYFQLLGCPLGQMAAALGIVVKTTVVATAILLTPVIVYRLISKLAQNTRKEGGS
jgi:hypothetical protein